MYKVEYGNKSIVFEARNDHHAVKRVVVKWNRDWTYIVHNCRLWKGGEHLFDISFPHPQSGKVATIHTR